VANGAREMPVPSLEMLSPLHVRPMVLLGLSALVYVVAVLVGGAIGAAATLVWLILLPASIGVAATNGEVVEAFNPVFLARTARGLGVYYPIILLLIGCYAGALAGLSRTSVPAVVQNAVFEFAVLSSFCAIGAVIHERRLQLGFEPRVSPEKTAELEDRVRVQARDRIVQEIFGYVRAGAYPQVREAVTRLLNEGDRDCLPDDVRAILTQAPRWENPRGLAVVGKCMILDLVRLRRAQLGLETYRAVVAHDPDFTLDSEESALALAHQASGAGEPRLAHSIVKRFADRAPSGGSKTVQALLQRLGS
jgi:hypothetical protein